MAQQRARNPTDLINEERVKIEEIFAAIVTYAEKLRQRQIAEDSRQHLLSR